MAVPTAPTRILCALRTGNKGSNIVEILRQQNSTASVLKYMPKPTSKNAPQTCTYHWTTNFNKIIKPALSVLSFFHTDYFTATKHIWENTKSFKINPTKIGLVKLSSEIAVTFEIAYNKTNILAFLRLIYAQTSVVPIQ
jgi:hypothetical protein